MSEPTTEIADGGQVFFTSPEVVKLLEHKKEAVPPPAEKKREEHMSRSEAITVLMRLAAGRTRTVEEVTALQMGALRLLTRSFQRQRNWARRREVAANAADAPNEPPAETPSAETAPHEPEPENTDK